MATTFPKIEPRFNEGNESVYPLIVRLPEGIAISDEQFFEIARLNEPRSLEQTPGGNLVFMSPTGWGSGSRNAELTFQLVAWARVDGTGIAFDSSTTVRFPGGGRRVPDACWVSLTRLEDSESAPESAITVAPEFVVEIVSPTDAVEAIQEKMLEYLEHGVRLGWMIDPQARCVSVYRRGKEVELFENPATLEAGPELPGFVLDLDRIWNPVKRPKLKA